jgi:hypothetical protein
MSDEPKTAGFRAFFMSGMGGNVVELGFGLGLDISAVCFLFSAFLRGCNITSVQGEGKGILN